MNPPTNIESLPGRFRFCHWWLKPVFHSYKSYTYSTFIGEDNEKKKHFRSILWLRRI